MVLLVLLSLLRFVLFVVFVIVVVVVVGVVAVAVAVGGGGEGGGGGVVAGFTISRDQACNIWAQQPASCARHTSKTGPHNRDGRQPTRRGDCNKSEKFHFCCNGVATKVKNFTFVAMRLQQK